MNARAIALFSLGLLTLTACPPEGVVSDDSDDTGADASESEAESESEDSPDEPINPNIPTGNFGSVYLVNYLDEPGQDLPVTELIALFVDDTDGLVNPALCIKHNRCATTTPSAPGQSVDNDPALRFDPTGKTFYRVGSPIRLGSHSAPIVTGATPYNFTSGPTGWQPGLAIGLKTDIGDWGAYNGTDDITLPAVIRPSSPSPAAAVTAISNETLQLTWEAGDGDVYLDVFSDGFWRTTWLPDTGSYNLDLSTIPFAPGATSASFHLSRQSEGSARINGNEIDLIARSTQRFTISLTNISGRTQLTPATTCSGAAAATPTPPGTYYGRINGSTGSLNPGATGCTSAATPGAEGLIKIEIPASNQLTATYNIPSGKPAVYLLSDCASAATPSCLAGKADTYASSTAPVTINWLNDGTSTRTLYLALDAVDAAGLFVLDLAIREVNVLVPHETCEAALAAAPVSSGSYVGSLATFQNSLNMPSTCTRYATAGRDGFVKISLQAGQTVSATYVAVGDDSSVYLLGDCNGTASVCLDGADDSVSAPETVRWTATSATDVILGLDCYTYGTPTNTDFTLDLDIR